MHYVDFYDQFTRSLHIRYVDWPVKFCTPHKLGVTQLRVLYDRLTNETAPPLFSALSADEWKVFRHKPRSEINTSFYEPATTQPAASSSSSTPLEPMSISTPPTTNTQLPSPAIDVSAPSVPSPSTPFVVETIPGVPSSSVTSEQPEKKKRKVRSDKGVSRPHAPGPHTRIS